MFRDWSDTPAGIGIDCVCVSEMRALDERLGGAFVQRTFTPGERELAGAAPDSWQFLAGRFAAKEAVFKALNGKAPNPFDFRVVETLRRADGCPVITPASVPPEAMETAGAKELLVSITGEGNFAIAMVQAV